MAAFPDADILRQLKSGEPAAFKVLFDQYYEPLCLQAALILHDAQQADDIVQQVFIRFWEERRYEQVEGNLLGYLRTMVKNSCFTFLKTSQKNQSRLVDYSRFLPEVNDQDLLEMKELGVQVQKAIDELPGQCRDIFIQACLEGKKYREVAEQQQISINTVKEQLRRAFRKMREKMRDLRMLL